MGVDVSVLISCFNYVLHPLFPDEVSGVKYPPKLQGLSRALLAVGPRAPGREQCPAWSLRQPWARALARLLGAGQRGSGAGAKALGDSAGPGFSSLIRLKDLAANCHQPNFSHFA